MINWNKYRQIVKEAGKQYKYISSMIWKEYQKRKIDWEEYQNIMSKAWNTYQESVSLAFMESKIKENEL